MKKLLVPSFIAQNSHTVTISNKIEEGGYTNSSYFTYTNENGAYQIVYLGASGTNHTIKVKTGTDIRIRLLAYIASASTQYAGIVTYPSMSGYLRCTLVYKENDPILIDRIVTIPHRATFKCDDETVTRDLLNDGDIIEAWVVSIPLDFPCCNNDNPLNPVP